MTNVFLLDYWSRLKQWVASREKLATHDIQTLCQGVDDFWQKCPIVNHYLHPDLITDWPDPWTLLSDNIYCYYARALGIIYTLMLMGITKLEFVVAKDDNNEEVVLVLVDDAKYVLNYWPGTILNNDINQFVITRRIDISPLYKKIGQ